MAVFRVEKTKDFYLDVQPSFKKQETYVKSKGIAVPDVVSAGFLGLYVERPGVNLQ